MTTATAPRHGPTRRARASLRRFIQRAFTVNVGAASWASSRQHGGGVTRAREASRPVRSPRGPACGRFRARAGRGARSEQREAAVLFVDLIGSTALAADREPQDVLS